jgi:peptidoglycan-associated lipoprotein
VHRISRIVVPAVIFIALVAVAGCKKKIPPATTATAPSVTLPAPTATLNASPSAVTAGDQVILSWNTTNTTTASIDGLGDVSPSGSKTVTPGATTSYHLVARGSGGTADATAHVTVTAPQSTAKAANPISAEDEFRANVQDVFFDYDKYALRSDAAAILSKDASYLASHPNVKIVIAGYCDERGSDEYNLALGQNRASSAQKLLIDNGIAASRIRVVSYGKERPFCSEATEACWQQNRRAGFGMAN